MEKDKLTWRDISEDYIIEQVSRIVENIVSKVPGYILESSSRYRYLAYRYILCHSCRLSIKNVVHATYILLKEC